MPYPGDAFAAPKGSPVSKGSCRRRRLWGCKCSIFVCFAARKVTPLSSALRLTLSPSGGQLVGAVAFREALHCGFAAYASPGRAAKITARSRCEPKFFSPAFPFHGKRYAAVLPAPPSPGCRIAVSAEALKRNKSSFCLLFLSRKSTVVTFLSRKVTALVLS